jgi:CheY-like chemotaxis protein
LDVLPLATLVAARNRFRFGGFGDASQGRNAFMGLITDVNNKAKPSPLDSYVCNKPLRILLADDHEVVRRGLAELLSSEPDMDVIGEASDGQEAVTLAKKLHPDVVVMDVDMPRMGGVEATRLIHSDSPAIRVVGLSMHCESDVVIAMWEAGASDFVDKSEPVQRLLRAMRYGH